MPDPSAAQPPPGGSKPPRQSQRLLKWKSRQAEEAVANHLRQRGYQIVARNWRHYLGELDIIARADDTLVIVEVKARHASEEGTGLASIDARKRNRLMLLAQAFTTAAQLRHLQLRFDVAEVELDKAGFVRDIRYLEDAFQQT